MAKRIIVRCRNRTGQKYDLLPAKRDGTPKTLLPRGRLEIGPEHFEGYHYKGLVQSGRVLELSRTEVPEKVVAPPKKPVPVPAKTSKRRARASTKNEALGSDLLSGDPASDSKDGV